VNPDPPLLSLCSHLCPAPGWVAERKIRFLTRCSCPPDRVLQGAAEWCASPPVALRCPWSSVACATSTILPPAKLERCHLHRVGRQITHSFAFYTALLAHAIMELARSSFGSMEICLLMLSEHRCRSRRRLRSTERSRISTATAPSSNSTVPGPRWPHPCRRPPK
jgi:hypothetical protein